MLTTIITKQPTSMLPPHSDTGRWGGHDDVRDGTREGEVAVADGQDPHPPAVSRRGRVAPPPAPVVFAAGGRRRRRGGGGRPPPGTRLRPDVGDATRERRIPRHVEIAYLVRARDARREDGGSPEEGADGAAVGDGGAVQSIDVARGVGRHRE